MSEPGAIVVGASSGVGRAIAEQLAADGWALVIGARRHSQLEAVADDLRSRHHVEVTPLPVDVAGSDDDLADFWRRAQAALPRLDALLVTAGAVADVDAGTDDWDTTTRLVTTNLVGVMKLAGGAVVTMEANGHGTVVVFSSIAAAAPRDRNVAYAAAKAGLESWGRSMRHRLADSPVDVQVYVLGYVDTPMAEGQQLRLPKADPAVVARRVVAGLDAGSRIVHEPRWWRPIVVTLRSLPWAVYKRLRF